MGNSFGLLILLPSAQRWQKPFFFMLLRGFIMLLSVASEEVTSKSVSVNHSRGWYLTIPTLVTKQQP